MYMIFLIYSNKNTGKINHGQFLQFLAKEIKIYIFSAALKFEYINQRMPRFE